MRYSRRTDRPLRGPWVPEHRWYGRTSGSPSVLSFTDSCPVRSQERPVLCDTCVYGGRTKETSTDVVRLGYSCPVVSFPTDYRHLVKTGKDTPTRLEGSRVVRPSSGNTVTVRGVVDGKSGSSPSNLGTTTDPSQRRSSASYPSKAREGRDRRGTGRKGPRVSVEDERGRPPVEGPVGVEVDDFRLGAKHPMTGAPSVEWVGGVMVVSVCRTNRAIGTGNGSHSVSHPEARRHGPSSLSPYPPTHRW